MVCEGPKALHTRHLPCTDPGVTYCCRLSTDTYRCLHITTLTDIITLSDRHAYAKLFFRFSRRWFPKRDPLDKLQEDPEVIRRAEK